MHIKYNIVSLTIISITLNYRNPAEVSSGAGHRWRFSLAKNQEEMKTTRMVPRLLAKVAFSQQITQFSLIQIEPDPDHTFCTRWVRSTFLSHCQLSTNLHRLITSVTLILFDCKNFWIPGNRTRGCQVRSKYITSVLCIPPPPLRIILFIEEHSQKTNLLERAPINFVST